MRLQSYINWGYSHRKAGPRTSNSEVARSQDWQIIAGSHQKTQFLSMLLLECHGMAAGLPQSKKFKRPSQMLQ